MGSNVEGLIANAPTRVGKSHTGVDYLLTEHGDVDCLFVSRSLNETANIIRIARLVADGTPVVEVVGREHFCVEPSAKEMYKNIRAVNDCFPFHFLCQGCLMSKGKIPTDDIFAESSVLSHKDIIEAALSMGVCPARLALKHVGKGVHVVTNYSFLVDPSVREASFLGPGQGAGYNPSNLFMDEGDVLLSALVDANVVSFSNVGLQQIYDRECTEFIRSYPDWRDPGLFTMGGSFVDVICHLRPRPAGEVDFVRVADFGYTPHDLDVCNADLVDVLTYLKRSYDVEARVETLNKIQVALTRGFFIQKLLMGLHYLSTNLDGFTRLPEVVEMIGPTGQPTGVGSVKCPKYKFFADNAYYMSFRENVSFLERPDRWKCFTSATIDPRSFQGWTQVRGEYMKREFRHVVPLRTLPFYSFKRGGGVRNFSIRGLIEKPESLYSLVNLALGALARRQLSCYVGFPSALIMKQYRDHYMRLSPCTAYFADGEQPLSVIQSAPINAKPCAIYFDYCRSKTVRGLDFFNYDVALLVSLPIQNVADWEWEAQQLTRVCRRFREFGMAISGQDEVKRRAVNEAAQFFSRVYTPENYVSKLFVTLDWRVKACAGLAPAWVQDLMYNVIEFDPDTIQRVLGGKAGPAEADVVGFLRPESPRTASQLAGSLNMSVEAVSRLLDEAVSRGRAVRRGDAFYLAQ